MKIRITAFLLLLSIGSVKAQTDSLGHHAAATFDERLFLSINHWGTSSPGLDGPMQFLSNSITPVEIAVPAGLLTYGWIYHDRKAAQAGISAGLAEASSGILTNLLKFVFRRDRPYVVLQDVRQPGTPAGGYSMPSGHSTAAWAVAGSLMCHYPRWEVIVPSVLYATGVSISRPYLGVHYPSDIVVGGLLGAGAGYFFTKYEDEVMTLFQWALPNESTKSSGVLMLPQFQDGSYGLTCVARF